MTDFPDLATTLRRFDELDAAEREAYKDLVYSTGDGAVTVMAKSDGAASELVADGGVDSEYREAIADAADSEAIDSFDQIDRAVRDVDGLTDVQKRQAQQLLIEADGSGVEFVDELDERTLRELLASSCGIDSPGSVVSESQGGSVAGSSTLGQAGRCVQLEVLVTGVEKSRTSLEDIGPRFNQLDTEMVRPVATRIGKNPSVAESLDSLSNRQVRQLADSTVGGEIADALGLHSMGASYTKVSSIAEDDALDLADLNTGLKRYDSNDIDVSTTDFSRAKGEVGESVARYLVRNEYPENGGYEIYNSIDLKDPQGGDSGELDFVVVDTDDNVVAVSEVKAGNNKAGRASKQLNDRMNEIENGDVSITHNDIDTDQFPSPNKVEEITIGPSSDSAYDMQVTLSSKEFDTLVEIILNR